MKKIVCALPLAMTLGLILTGCGAARFSLSKDGSVSPAGVVPPVLQAPGAPGSGGMNYNCDTPSTDPDHLIPLNQLGRKAQRLVLSFDNRPVTAQLIEASNRNKSLAFTYWNTRNDISVFVDVLKSEWSRTEPTNPEITCFIDQSGVTAIPQATPMPFQRMYTREVGGNIVKADFTNLNHPTQPQVGTFNLSCQKNRRVRGNRNSELTLADVNKVLCGVASVHIN